MLEIIERAGTSTRSGVPINRVRCSGCGDVYLVTSWPGELRAAQRVCDACAKPVALEKRCPGGAERAAARRQAKRDRAIAREEKRAAKAAKPKRSRKPGAPEQRVPVSFSVPRKVIDQLDGFIEQLRGLGREKVTRSELLVLALKRLCSGKYANRAASALGQRGGLKGGPARANALSPEQRKASAVHAATIRWGAVRVKHGDQAEPLTPSDPEPQQ